MSALATCKLTAPDTLRGRWDRLSIEQIVGNIISNAIEYGDGKPVHVSLARDQPRAHDSLHLDAQHRAARPEGNPVDEHGKPQHSRHRRERPSKGLSSLLEGLTSFLRKPFRIPALLEIIESVLRHRSHPPQS